MKRYAVKAAALSLSTISLASTVTFPVHAQAPEESESLVLVSEDNSETLQAASEQQVTNDAADTSQLLDSLEPVEGAVSEEDIPNIEETVGATENIEKAKDAMDESEAMAKEASELVAEITEETKQSTGQAVETATEAATVISDENTTEAEAEAIIGDAEKTVDQAEVDYISAEDAYNKKLEEYQAAKEDYETAVAAYNSNKEKANADLAAAQEKLDAAKEKLDALEKQLEAAQKDLVDAGATAIISADDNKSTDVAAYVASVVQYYYAPKMLLAEGEQIQNFVVSDTSAEYVTITYDVYDKDGKFVRSTKADYGFDVDKATGEIRIYDNKLEYTYTDANGKEIVLSKEDAEKLKDGLVEIDSYWTATGFYIPRYSADYHYTGTIPAKDYSDSKAIKQGSDAAKAAYSDGTKYYNADASFVSGTRSSGDYVAKYDLNLNYKVSYDRVVYRHFKVGGYTQTYSDVVADIVANGGIVISTEAEYKRGILRYVEGVAISDAIKSGKYGSYSEALTAVRQEALNNKGVVGIDLSNSSLDISEQPVYAKVEKAYNNIFSSFNSNYSEYVAELRTKLAGYSESLKTVAKAKEEYSAASEKVADLRQQISKLNAADDITAAATITKLEIELEKAEANYKQAKENLDNAKSALADAKTTFDSRFNSEVDEEIVEEIVESASETFDDSDSIEIAPAIVLPEVILPEEILKEIEEVEDDDDDDSDSSDNGGGESVAEEEEVPEEVPAEIPPETEEIPEEEAPAGVTIAGLLARGKWFVGLAGVSTAGVGVAVIEAKRRAAIKLIDKLSQ